MLALLLMTLVSTSSAQDEFTDVAAPEEDGCWGSAIFAYPDPFSTDVPLDASPRFFVGGQCADAVQVTLIDPSGMDVPVALDAQELSDGTTFVVDPAADLTPMTTYILTISTEFDVDMDLVFTTGEQPTSETSELTIVDATLDAECACPAGRVLNYLALDIASESDGLAGYVRPTDDTQATWMPVLVDQGMASVTLVQTVAFGQTELCVSVATFATDGTLGEWQEVCTDAPNIGSCAPDWDECNQPEPEPRRRTVFGCGGNDMADDPTPLSAVVFLPLLGLFGLGRRRKSTT